MSYGVGAQIDISEIEIISAAMLGRRVAVATELAHINVAIAALAFVATTVITVIASRAPFNFVFS